MARNKLTDAAVRSAEPGRHGDGDGLWLHVGKQGSRSWVFIFIRNGRRREMGLGPYGRGTGQVSLASARAKADEVREILGRGGDPFQELPERASKLKSVTFGECADDLVASLKPGWKNSKHAAQWAMTLDTYARSLRKLPVEAVTVDDVLKCLKPIWLEKPETASRTRGRIEKVLDYATARKLRSGENPARWKGNLDHLLPRQDRKKTKHHAALPYAEVPAFWKKLQDAEGIAAKALSFTILTAARTGEVLGATWNEIDFEKSVWTISADRMKAGREHTVPLTSTALEILEWAQQHALDEFIFPGARKNKGLSNMAMTSVLRRLGHAEVTVHGFRSSFRDWAGNETSVPREVVEEALAHLVGNEVERAYRRTAALEKRRKLMELWERYTSPVPAGVVKLQQRAS